MAAVRPSGLPFTAAAGTGEWRFHACYLVKIVLLGRAFGFVDIRFAAGGSFAQLLPVYLAEKG